jgi:hypothetical protein
MSARPKPFDTEEGIKAIPSLLHPILHRLHSIANFVQGFLTDMDTTLYSASFRAHLQSRLGSNTLINTYLADADQTRTHLYRFFCKGSNDLLLIEMYLRNKYGILHTSSLPADFESDWDTAILLNPALPNDVFGLLFDEIRNVCLSKLMAHSRILADIHEYHTGIHTGISVAGHFIESTGNYAPFQGWKITFKKDAQKPLQVHDAVRGKNTDRDVVERLGLSGKGTLVRSNYTPFEGSQFYLARLMANVVAGNGIVLPVEIIDVAIPYKGEELDLAWEGHTEWHFVYNGFDYRILSPVGFYVDLAKTIRNGERSGNRRGTRKLGKRIQRVQRLLNEVIRPYGLRNETIQSNIARLSTSHTAVGSAVRALTRRLENRRLIRTSTDLFEDE